MVGRALAFKTTGRGFAPRQRFLFFTRRLDKVFKLINQISQRGDMKHQVRKLLAFKTIGLFPSSDVGDAFQAYTC